MTYKEIKDFLSNTKIYVSKRSKEVQEKLFSLGYVWENGSQKVKHTDKPFIYITDSNISYGVDFRLFTDSNRKEIYADEILSIEFTEPTYKPFQSADECWIEMLKHQPFGWIKPIDCENNYQCVLNVNRSNNFKEMFNTFVFIDGTPFGTEVPTLTEK